MKIAEQLRLLRESDIIPDADTPIDPQSGMDIEPYRLLDMAIDIVEENTQRQKEEYRDTGKSIKDLEAELDHMYLREPNDVKYIASLKQKVDILYKKLNQLDNQLRGVYPMICK